MGCGDSPAGAPAALPGTAACALPRRRATLAPRPNARLSALQGVFARRGANIESLAVGLTVDKALFTIVATGTDATVANLSKQIAKLVNVR